MPARTYKVTKVNPSKKGRKKVAKKKATKKRATKKPARKKASTSKRTTTRKAKPVAKKRRKTRAKKTTTTRRRRRPAARKRSAPRKSRKNPMLSLDLKQPFMHAIPSTLGQMVVAGIVNKWGTFKGDASYSPIAGVSWTGRNYVLGYLAAVVGGEMLGRFGGRRAWGQAFYNGAFELMKTKLVWTEVFARVPMLKEYLGVAEGGGQFKALAAQATEGDIWDDGQGNRWLLQNGQWVSMQGADPYTPQTLGADPYTPKELSGVLTDADYLGGVLTDADYLGGAGRMSTPMGHAMPPETSRAYATQAQYQDTGSPSPYHNVYQQ